MVKTKVPTSEEWRDWLEEDLDGRVFEMISGSPAYRLFVDGTLPDDPRDLVALIHLSVTYGWLKVLSNLLLHSSMSITHFVARDAARNSVVEPKVLAEFVDHFLVPQGKTLHTFDIEGWNFSDPGCIGVLANGLARCDKLEVLRLDSCHLTGKAADTLLAARTQWPLLRILSFSGNAEGDALLKSITNRLLSKAMPVLGEVHLRKCRLRGTESISAFSDLKKVTTFRKLDLSFNPIEAQAAAAIFPLLAELPLQALDLFDSISRECAPHLICILRGPLTRLAIGGSAFRLPPGFAETLQKNKSLVSLSLVECDADSEMWRVMNVVGSSNSLKLLSLHGTDLYRAESQTALIDMVERSKLTHLILSNCDLEDDDLANVFGILNTNHSHLTELVLAGNTMYENACSAAAEYLEDIQTLKTLDISRCDINDESFKEMLGGLGSKTSLTSINLSNNKLGAASLAALLSAIDNQQNLVNVQLGGNRFDLKDPQVQALFHRLLGAKSSSSLASLDYHQFLNAKVYDWARIEKALVTNAKLSNPHIQNFLKESVCRLLQTKIHIQDLGLQLWALLEATPHPDNRYGALRSAVRLSQHALRTLLIDGTLPRDDREHAELIVGCLCIGAPTVLREVLKRTRLSSSGFQARTTSAWPDMLEPRLDPASARVLVDEFLVPFGATLQVFDIKSWDLSDAKSVQVLCEGLAHCKVLRTLKLEDCELNGLASRAILDSVKGSWPVLEQLSLSSNALGNAAAACVAERLQSFPSLKVLRLEACDITQPGALALAGALHGKLALQVLDLSMNLIGDAAAAAILAALSGSVSLTELDLTHCHLGELCAGQLGALLGSKTPLQTLRIGWNRMQATPAFVEGIRRNSTLRKLHLEHSGSANFIAQVLGALKSHASLRELVLHGNPLNDKRAVETLMDVLPRSKLARIDLADCQFDDNCCSLVLGALTRISTLEVLILSDNHLQIRACGNAGSLLGNSRTLRRLDLRGCAIDDEGTRALTRPLLKVKSPSLTRVDVSHNKIGSKGLAHLLQVMDVQPNLVSLSIGKNAFHLALPEVQTQLDQAVTKSTSLTFIDYFNCNGAHAYDGSTIERRLRANARLTNPSTQKYLLDLVARLVNELLGMNDVGPRIWEQLRDSLDPDRRYVQLRAALRLSEVCHGIRFGHGSRQLLDSRRAAENEQLAAELQAQDAAEDDSKPH